jgi:hypothetical protein
MTHQAKRQAIVPPRREAVTVGGQPIDSVAQQPLLVVPIEIHQSPSTAADRMFFWISWLPP